VVPDLAQERQVSIWTYCKLQCYELIDLSLEAVHLVVQSCDLRFTFQVDLIVHRCSEAVLRGLTVLAHHDDGRLHSGDHRQEQVQEDIRIRIEGVGGEQNGINQRPASEKQTEANDKASGTADGCNPVGQTLAQGEAAVKLLIQVFGCMDASGHPRDDAPLPGAKWRKTRMQQVLGKEPNFCIHSSPSFQPAFSRQRQVNRSGDQAAARNRDGMVNRL
jgi:hypothetical protein